MCESTFWIKMSNIPSDIIIKHKININLTTKYLFQIRRKKEKRKETPLTRLLNFINYMNFCPRKWISRNY